MPDPQHPSLTRRQLLRGAAVGGLGLVAAPLLSGTASATTAVPRATGPTLAQAAGMTGTLTDIDHVVFLMLENRSFDHLFGTLSGVRGFDDRSITRPDGGNIFAQYDADTGRYELPFLLSAANNGQNTPSLSHNWGPQHRALNGGKNDNWIGAHRAADGANGIFTMGYYTRNELPYHYALADGFTVLDHYHCSVLGPTYPNRLMWEVGSLDPNGVGGGPLLTTDEAVFTNNNGQGVFSYETYPERLTKAGVTWRAYTDEASNHLLNMFPSFKQYEDKTALPGSMANKLYMNGSFTSSQDEFVLDAAANNLPQVSWIFPTAGNTEHPDDGTPNMGPEYYHPIITALMESASWPKTALFITWDENDGYFDHVPPPTAPAGTPLEFLTHAAFGKTATSDPAQGISGPVGLGFRVPTLVVSPFARGGFVSSEVFDHTSGLFFVERRWGVSLEGIISDWRRATVGDFTSTMDFTKPDLSVPPGLGPAFAASQQKVESTGTETVPQEQTMPVQEPGARPRRGPVPADAGPPAVVPEVGRPAVLVGVGTAAALAAVAARRHRSGAEPTDAGAELPAG